VHLAKAGHVRQALVLRTKPAAHQKQSQPASNQNKQNYQLMTKQKLMESNRLQATHRLGKGTYVPAAGRTLARHLLSAQRLLEIYQRYPNNCYKTT